MADIKQQPKKNYSKEEQIAIVKASNQMLTEALGRMIERGVEDSKIQEMKTAIGENLDYAKHSLDATKEDVDNAMYHGASISAIKSYEERLKRKGITDEEMRRKDIATTGATTVQNGETASEPAKKRRQRKKKAAGESDSGAKKPDTKEAPQVIEEAKPPVAHTNPGPKDAVRKEEQPDKDKYYNIEQFNLDEIPDYVQYDIIPLPSRGQCYPNKKSRIPVAYLTAADENIIASPNMYRDGKLIDVILRRKILDKNVDIDQLCTGDRDAIVLWLRATSYGDDFPISAEDPVSGKRYETTVKLSSLKYKNLMLEGDEDGLLTYQDGKNVIKFRYPSHADEEELRERLSRQMGNHDRYTALMSLFRLKADMKKVDISEEDRKNATEDIDELSDILYAIADEEKVNYPETITEQMKIYTKSVNGNSDPEYISKFIDNMRSGDALKYREFVNENFPGVDFKVTVNRPESDGGGSFDTFLRLDDNVFLNF